MVKKANGKWRMFVDFTDHNKACPKDYYLLPNINTLVYSTFGYRKLNFLDAFLGYHQIRIKGVDQVHTSFRAIGKIYCYNVMSFSVENVGATYQRMVDKVFKEQIGRNVKVYVDNMVVKTPKGKSHIEDLEETFQTLIHFQQKLNPTKCTFGVHSEKFLGS